MTEKAKIRIAALVNAIRNMDVDPFRDAKYTFALEILKGTPGPLAAKAALIGLNQQKAFHADNRPSPDWEKDPLVCAYKALLRAEGGELYAPTREEMAWSLIARSKDRNSKPIDCARLILAAHRLMGYSAAKDGQ